MDELWLDLFFTHNFFASPSFLLWTSPGPRATILAVRKSSDASLSVPPAACETGRSLTGVGKRNGRQIRSGPPTRSGRDRVPASERHGATGAARSAGPTEFAQATAVSDPRMAFEPFDRWDNARGGATVTRLPERTCQSAVALRCRLRVPEPCRRRGRKHSSRRVFGPIANGW